MESVIAALGAREQALWRVLKAALDAGSDFATTGEMWKHAPETWAEQVAAVVTKAVVPLIENLNQPL